MEYTAATLILCAVVTAIQIVLYSKSMKHIDRIDYVNRMNEGKHRAQLEALEYRAAQLSEDLETKVGREITARLASVETPRYTMSITEPKVTATPGKITKRSTAKKRNK